MKGTRFTKERQTISDGFLPCFIHSFLLQWFVSKNKSGGAFNFEPQQSEVKEGSEQWNESEGKKVLLHPIFTLHTLSTCLFFLSQHHESLLHLLILTLSSDMTMKNDGCPFYNLEGWKTLFFFFLHLSITIMIEQPFEPTFTTKSREYVIGKREKERERDAVSEFLVLAWNDSLSIDPSLMMMPVKWSRYSISYLHLPPSSFPLRVNVSEREMTEGNLDDDDVARMKRGESDFQECPFSFLYQMMVSSMACLLSRIWRMLLSISSIPIQIHANSSDFQFVVRTPTSGVTRKEYMMSDGTWLISHLQQFCSSNSEVKCFYAK